MLRRNGTLRRRENMWVMMLGGCGVGDDAKRNGWDIENTI
jgi:hypothetical protein